MKTRALPLITSLFAVLLAITSSAPAYAEDLVSGLSQDTIQINSNYTGTDIVVFGAIEAPDVLDADSTRDVVVVVRGPSTDMIVRRKARVAGIWINRDEITLNGMPSYYFAASTRPISQLASSDTLQRYQLGVENLYPRAMSTSSPPKGEPFRKAAIRDMQRQRLYTAAQWRGIFELFAVPCACAGSRQCTARTIHGRGLSVPQRHRDERAINAALCRSDRAGTQAVQFCA